MFSFTINVNAWEKVPVPDYVDKKTKSPWNFFENFEDGKLRFKYVANGRNISNSPGKKPYKIKIWYAKSSVRDFRNIKWRTKKFVLKPSEFIYSFNKPKKKYLALFAEIIYKTKSENFSLSLISLENSGL